MSKKLICLISFVFVLCVAGSVSADTFIFDEFDDGDMATNTSGVGSGFEVAVRNEGSVTEADGLVTILGGNTGASRNQIGSKESFSANDSPVFGIFTVTDMYREQSIDNGTARFYAGFCPTLPNFQGPVENSVDGLWIVVHSRYNLAGIDTWDTGDGGLVHIDGGVRTTLAKWAWDTSVFTFDTASGLRSDRVALDMIASDLTFVLSSDAHGYSLSISSTDGTAVLPDAVSGTWAAAGVTNDLSEVYASVWTQGACPDNEMGLVLDRIVVNEEGWTEGAKFPLARAPKPADGSMLESTWTTLTWRPGDFAVSHDVYVGDNFDDVNDGAEGTFVGNQTKTDIIVGFPTFPIPGGLVPGTTYYWRIDEVNDTEPNSPWKGNVWSFWIQPNKAYDPIPADGVKYVLPDVTLSWTPGLGAQLHYVYFGDNFDDVNNAVGALPQTDATYTPGTLELDMVYYWRVDEFDGVATHKGNVWSFTTMPKINVTDTNLIGWWTLDEGMGVTAVDWSGHGNHGTLFGTEWTTPGYLGDAALKMNAGYVAIQNLSYNDPNGTAVTVCAWIRTNSAANQYIASFDRDNYWRLEINGSGAGDGQVGWDVMTSSGQVDYGSSRRVDDGLWHHVCGVFDNGRLTIYIDGFAEPSVSGGPTFGSGEMRSGFIGGNSEAGGYNGGPPVQYIDELRIYDKALTAEEIQLAMRGDPLLAWGPKPSQGSAVYIREATPLSWSPGDNASQHHIYFGTDRDVVAVADASDTTGIYRGRQSVTIYTPPEVEWGGGPYYWRVDEYNTDGTISKGNLWSFTVTDFIGIEDFEDYNDYEPDRIFETWIDGWGVATNGSEVGYAEPNFPDGEHHVETTIVHGGSQSMPYFYENNFKYSEATYPPTQRDWAEEGVGVLSLWFYGDAANAAERMYVALNGIATVYHDNPDAALIEEWTEWRIDLQEFAAKGVNLANVNTISIGFGDKNNLRAGGSGLVFFDDIRLYRPAPEPEPAP
jgi:hypothetical protein